MPDAVIAVGDALEIVRLRLENVQGLFGLLGAIEGKGEAKWFRPHPFTLEHLKTLCQPGKRDLFYLMSANAAVFGYGLLRGWDEGYDIPSLGLAVHPNYRSIGLGSTMIQFLHCAARARGCQRVRLRVEQGNSAAINLYLRMGYRFESPVDGDVDAGRFVVGFKELWV